MIQEFFTVEVIISLVFSAISLALTYLAGKIKNEKLRVAALKALAITNEVKKQMLEAEKMTNYSGKEKLTFVLSRMQTYLATQKLIYNEAVIVDIVENEIALTKQVNAREKDAQADNVF